MALHLTKVAYGAQSLEEIHGWFADRGAEAFLTTRYLPKRFAEVLEGGSLYWIHKHHLVARSPILRFDDAPGGKTNIVVSTRLIDVRPLPRRARLLELQDRRAAARPVLEVLEDPLDERVARGEEVELLAEDGLLHLRHDDIEILER